MELAAESCVVKCGKCLRLMRDRSSASVGSLTEGDGGYLTSTDSHTSFQACLASQSKVTMQSVNKKLASAMTTKLLTLPQIQENLCPQSFPVASALLECSLEESALSFNSISSNPSARLDPSWKSFLKKFRPEAFSSARSSREHEIVPETEIQNEFFSDATASLEEVTFQETERDVNDTVMTMIGRKHAGQKREKQKSNRLTSFSRKTVPVVQDDDQDSPLARSSAPFNFTVLPSNVDIPIDEVSTRDRGLPLLPEERKKLEARYVDVQELSPKSIHSSFKSKRRWLSQGGTSSVRRKKASMKSLDAIANVTRLELIPKVAGVCDGSRNRRSRGELWIRA